MRRFPRVAPGHPITAVWANQVADMMNEFIASRANGEAATFQGIGNQLVIPASLRIERFTLTEALAPGESATATLLYIDKDGNETDGPGITVYDALGDTSASEGGRGYAVFMSDSGHWEVLVMICV